MDHKNDYPGIKFGIECIVTQTLTFAYLPNDLVNHTDVTELMLFQSYDFIGPDQSLEQPLTFTLAHINTV